MKYELGFYIPEDILHSHSRDNLKSYTGKEYDANFCVVTRYSPVEARRHLEGIYRFHLQGAKLSDIKKSRAVPCRLFLCLLCTLTLKMAQICPSRIPLDVCPYAAL
jgi:hypothetical protein